MKELEIDGINHNHILTNPIVNEILKLETSGKLTHKEALTGMVNALADANAELEKVNYQMSGINAVLLEVFGIKHAVARNSKDLKDELMRIISELKEELEKEKRKHAMTLWEYCDSVKKEDYDSLKAEHEKALKQIEHDRIKMGELTNEIDCKRMELPPEEPIGAAAWLINAKRKRETNSLQRFFHSSERYEDYDAYSVSDLREIAEHLLAYCKNHESEVGTDVRD